MRFYIAGPITTDEKWQEHFADAEEFLRTRYPKADIINPLTLEDEPECQMAREHIEDENELWNWMLKRDIRYLMTCTHIYMLNGWENSRGAKLELRTALDVGIAPCFQNCFNTI